MKLSSTSSLFLLNEYYSNQRNARCEHYINGVCVSMKLIEYILVAMVTHLLFVVLFVLVFFCYYRFASAPYCCLFICLM